MAFRWVASTRRYGASRLLRTSASLPCCTSGVKLVDVPCRTLASKRNKRFKAKKKKNKMGPTVDGDSWRRNKIEKLKKQLANDPGVVTSPTTTELAPMTTAIPQVNDSISQDECERREKVLTEDVVTWTSGLSLSVKKQLTEDISLIRIGSLSHAEAVAALAESLKVLESNNGSTIDSLELKRVLDCRRDRELFWRKLIEFPNKIVDTKTVGRTLEQHLKPPIEDRESMESRMTKVWLAALPPYRRREYYERKSDCLFRLKPQTVVQGKGPSMYPTLWSGDYLYRRILVEDIGEQVKRDHVVSLILYQKGSQARNVTKRVTALAGDEVEYKGERVLVPENCIWVEGDNKEKSYDSRHYGAVPWNNVKAQCLVTYSVPPAGLRYKLLDPSCEVSPWVVLGAHLKENLSTFF